MKLIVDIPDKTYNSIMSMDWKNAGWLFGEELKSIHDAVPLKQGHWILDETDNSITCDKCGCLIWANDISNGEAYYCPNCGADMRGDTGC